MTSKAQYDELWAEAWGDMQSIGPVHRHNTNSLKTIVKSLNVETILDIGCGSGDNLASLQKSFPNIQYSGVDVSSAALEIAQKRAPGATFRELNIERESLPEKFDLVMSLQVVEHLMDDISAIRNIAAMSKKWVLITTMRGKMRSSELKIGHFRNYSDAELTAKAGAANLEVVDIFGWGFPFYSPLYRTVAEWIPGGPPTGKFGTGQRIVANLLYHLYSLNIPRKGDVVTMLCRPNSALKA